MVSRSWMIALLPALLASILALNGCTAPRPIDSIRTSGDNRFKAGDFAGARDEYAEIVSRYPGDWEAQFKLGVSQLKTGNASAARRALETAYTLKPANKDISDSLAEAMFQQGDESRLFAFLRERATSTQTVESHLQLARYAAELNDPDSAQTAINTAIEIDNGKTTAPYLQAAELAQRLGHLDEAVRRLRQAYGINPGDIRVTDKLRALGEQPGKVTPLPPGR